MASTMETVTSLYFISRKFGCQHPNDTLRCNKITPDPPYDIVVFLEHSDFGSMQFLFAKHLLNYYADEAYIQNNNPNFKKNMLVVAPDMKSSLKTEHKEYLREHFNLTVYEMLKILWTSRLSVHMLKTKTVI